MITLNLGKPQIACVVLIEESVSNHIYFCTKINKWFVDVWSLSDKASCTGKQDVDFQKSTSVIAKNQSIEIFAINISIKRSYM